MHERRVTIMAASGLHARPASIFTQAAAGYDHEVFIGRDGEDPVDATSILMVMGLALQHGEDVVLRTDSAAGSTAIDELAALLATDLDAV